MESCATIPAAAPAKFSRYRSVRKAAVVEEEPPAVPNLPQAPIRAQQADDKLERAPSRYHRRPKTSQRHDVPLPVAPKPIVPTQPSRYVRSKASKPDRIAEDHHVHEPIPQSPPVPQEQEQTRKRTPPEVDLLETSIEPLQQVTSATGRYRSRTTSASRDRAQTNRRSYDQAREEARLILEGEYDRLEKLRKHQQRTEQERKRRAEEKAAAQRAQEAKEEEARRQAEQVKIVEEPQPQVQRSRKWTIGGGSSHKSPPTSVPHSPHSSEKPQKVQSPRSQVPSRDGRQDHPEIQSAGPVQESTKPSEVEKPSLKKRIRRPTQSRPKDPPATRTFEPRVGDGPPKTAVNGPAQTVDAPVSAVNAGERRVQLRNGKATIYLPVTPTTTVKDLLNSASVIMSQPIDPRTDVLIETYYPLGLERPLRRYECIRDVMNSWDSDTQNYLMVLPAAECEAINLDQKDAPEDQPPLTMVSLYHSRKPGKWEKHWMIIKGDGQVTASTKENDGNAMNVFHLSDFDVYMPTKKEMKKLRPPKKICFAIKSQQRSIMFESTENFVHFFSTGDKAVADQWYNAVQAWRSWYLVNVLESGASKLPPPASAAALANLSMPQRRPSTSHSRDSTFYQLGTFQPLLDFTADAFSYGEDSIPKPTTTNAPSSLPQRNKTLIDHARNQSITDTKVTGLERHLTTKRSNQHNHSARPSTSAPCFQKHARDDSLIVQPPPSSTDAAFTGKGLLARAFSVRKAAAEESYTALQDTNNAFTGKGLLSTAASSSTTKPSISSSGVGGARGAENLNPGVIAENTNDAFTGAGLLSSVQRAPTRKKSRPGQPLVDLAANSQFEDGSLLRRVEGYEAANGLSGVAIDRSRGVEISAKTGEV